jgi:hypothetical protein
MQCLIVALSLAAPRTFPQFANWRRVPIQVPFQKDINDSVVFSMKFIRFYNGEGHGSLQTTIDLVWILFLVNISLISFSLFLNFFFLPRSIKGVEGRDATKIAFAFCADSLTFLNDLPLCYLLWMEKLFCFLLSVKVPYDAVGFIFSYHAGLCFISFGNSKSYKC